MPGESRRLTSWKEISAYIGRDVRTVARWEKDRGLPVHRVPGSRGRGSTVFAWSHEIDEWMAGADPAEREVTPASVVSPSRARRWRIHGLALGGAAAIVVAAFVGVFRPPWLRGAEAVASLEVRGTDVVAVSSSGKVVWTHPFADPISVAPDNLIAIDDFDHDGAVETLAVLSRQHDAQGRQELYCFSHDGAVRWQFAPQDAFDFGNEFFGPPWSAGPVTVLEHQASGRILWLTHHHTWWPGVARILSPDGREVSRFVNPGWITNAAESDTGLVLLSGVNNAEDGDMFAVLDARSLPGSAPPAANASYRCGNCPDGRPLHYFVLPRGELNRVTGAPREGTHIHPYASGTEIETHQIPGDALMPAAAIVFDFTREFTPLRAHPNDAYWSWHDRLYRDGRIDHPAARCPERRGFTIKQWDRDLGWRTIHVPSTSAETP